MVDDFERIRQEFLRSFMIPAVEFDQNPTTASKQPTMFAGDSLLKLIREWNMREHIRDQLKSGRGIYVYDSHWMPKDKIAIVPQGDLKGDYVIICHEDHKPAVQALIAKIAKELTSNG